MAIKSVIVGSSIKTVIAKPAQQAVIAGIAKDRVVATAARAGVCAGAEDQVFVIGKARDVIIADASVDALPCPVVKTGLGNQRVILAGDEMRRQALQGERFGWPKRAAKGAVTAVTLV